MTIGGREGILRTSSSLTPLPVKDRQVIATPPDDL